MPLCAACRDEAIQIRHYRHIFRKETVPPHGMSWGDECDRCRLVAGVTF